MDALLADVFKKAQAAANDAGKANLLREQRQWLAGRAAACPSIAANAPNEQNEDAYDCLEGLYGQRVAVLRLGAMQAAWPKLPFRPSLVRGEKLPVCQAIAKDLQAVFFGSDPWINPLGEREIGFAWVPGLTNFNAFRRAEFDPYNTGKPVEVFKMIGDPSMDRFPIGYYQVATKENYPKILKELGENPGSTLYDYLAPLIDADGAEVIVEAPPKFASDSQLIVPALPRFFRFGGKIYLYNPGYYYDEKGGVYELANSKEADERCAFRTELGTDAELQLYKKVTDSAKLSEREGFAAPLLPHGQVCQAYGGDESYTRTARALWRPWALENWPNLPDPHGPAHLDRYLTNRGLTGLEHHRQWLKYDAARKHAIDAIAPYYVAEFGRGEAEAKGIASLWLDQELHDEALFDGDEPTAALFAEDFAASHGAAIAAFAGDLVMLNKALGADVKAAIRKPLGPFDEPLLIDALEHPEMLRALLEMGFDVDQLGATGRSPLMTAARLDLPQAATILLEHGAKPNLAGSEAVTKVFEPSDDVMCLKRGDPPVVDTPGRTALSYAAELASPEMVKVLIAHGADPELADKGGVTPAEWSGDRKDDAGREIRKLVLSPEAFHLDLGAQLYHDGKLEEAEKEFQEAIDLNKNNSVSHVALGNLLFDRKKYPDATVELTLAAKLDPKAAEPHAGLGKVLAAQERYDDAVAEFRIAIANDPKDAILHRELGGVLAKQGKLDDAIAEFRAAIKLGPDSSPPHLSLAEALHAQKKDAEAGPEYWEAIRLDQTNPAPHYARARFFTDMGQTKDADDEMKWAKRLEH